MGLITMFFELIIAIPLGIAAAKKQYSFTDYFTTVVAMICISMPTFFLATLLKYIFSVKLTAEYYLTFCDISSKVRDRMGLVILRHGKDRDHCNRTLLSLLTACSFIKRSKVGVHVSGISSTSGNLFTGSTYLTKCICVVSNICHDYKYVHSFFKCKILCCSQCHTRC